MSAPFEGVEKALELVVDEGSTPLRALGEPFFRELVARADGSVLRRSTYACFDAYLLAESTLFVGDRHLVMLTCGRTRVHRAASHLLDALDAASITLLSLTRLGERFPDAQETTFEEDVERLRARIEGRVLRLGERGPHRGGAFVFERGGRAPALGETRLRLVANDIDPEVARVFEGAPRPYVDEALAPLTRLFGEGAHEVYDFMPSGHSRNVVRGSATYALHVTPEQASSYVSLVSSDPSEETSAALTAAMLAIFRPRTCLVTSDARVALPERYRVAHRAEHALATHALHVVEAALD